MKRRRKHIVFLLNRGLAPATGIKAFADQKNDWVIRHFVLSPQAVENAIAWGADGVFTQLYYPYQVAPILKLNCPLVDVGGGFISPSFYSVRPDEYAIGRAAAEHFIGRGHRSFAFAGREPSTADQPGIQNVPWCEERKQGFEARLNEDGFKLNAQFDVPGLLFPDEPENRETFEQLHRRLVRKLKQLPRPCAVFAAMDIIGANIAGLALELGIRVPQDMAILGVNNYTHICEVSTPTLSSIPLPNWQIGYKAAELMERAMAGGPSGEVIKVAPPPIVVRASSEHAAVQDEFVRAAMHFIGQCNGLQIDVGDVVAEVGLSRRPLERRFRDVLGSTIREEIENAHVHRGKALLAETRMSIAEVAKASGFSDPNRFSVVFRNAVGMPPSKFRDQYRRD